MNTSSNIHEKKATFFHKLLKGSASPSITVNGDMLKKERKRHQSLKISNSPLSFQPHNYILFIWNY